MSRDQVTFKFIKIIILKNQTNLKKKKKKQQQQQQQKKKKKEMMMMMLLLLMKAESSKTEQGMQVSASPSGSFSHFYFSFTKPKNPKKWWFKKPVLNKRCQITATISIHLNYSRIHDNSSYLQLADKWFVVNKKKKKKKKKKKSEHVYEKKT